MAQIFSGFPDTRRSGLLCEIMTRLHNGGLSTAQLQVWGKGGNPNDYKTCRAREWLNFYEDLFDFKVPIEEYHCKDNVAWNIDHSGYYLTVLADVSMLPLDKIISTWNAKVAPSLAISTEKLNGIDINDIKSRYKHYEFGYRSTCLQVLKNKEEELSCIKQESSEHGFPGSTLRAILLELMFMFWRYGKMDLVKNIYKSDLNKIKKLDTYILPCSQSPFPNQVDEKNESFPFVVLSKQYHISIYPRGSSQLLKLYQQGSIVALHHY